VLLRCVVVDDSAAFLRAARILLERDGLTVAGVASTTAEALAQVRVLRPDVVLADIMLGDESGFSLATELAADSEGGASSVILISAGPDADYGDLIASSDAIGFIPGRSCPRCASASCSPPARANGHPGRRGPPAPGDGRHPIPAAGAS
jgi:two-component system, NarL family, nitrate/nitrite response regulator NarL